MIRGQTAQRRPVTGQRTLHDYRNVGEPGHHLNVLDAGAGRKSAQPRAEDGCITEARCAACFSFPYHHLAFETTATMPSTSRTPVRKALSIGIEYKGLSEKFPQFGLNLPAAHGDAAMMSEILQGGFHGLFYCALLDLATRLVWLSAREHHDPHGCEGFQHVADES